MARILGIGNATLDIINTVERYPVEDDEVRALSQRRCVGGNCANTLIVLQQLGHDCVFAGTLATNTDGDEIALGLQQQGINIDYCHRVSGKSPTSYILLNRDTGTRTIVHYRDLSELSLADFEKIDLSTFDWIHVEGRNVIETTSMLGYIHERFPSLPYSVEIEKPRTGIENLFKGAAVLFFSRHYVTHLGYLNGQGFLQQLHPSLPNIEKICPWGEAGAYGIDQKGEICHSPAFSPLQVIDTLGAGDTFNAGFIHARLHHYPFAKSLAFACQLAGRKCGQYGFEGLRS